MPDNEHPVEMRSAEMEELIGTIPPWIIRWGITVLFVVAIIGLSVSTFISFPDTIPVKVLIEAANQPGHVTVTRTDASQVFRFLVKSGETVKPGDTLLVRYDKNTGKSYPVLTPMAGVIYVSDGVNAANILDKEIWVVPQSSAVKVKINYGNKGAGNIRVGQTVQIELADFPSNEYGFLQGRITSILPILIDGLHQAYVQLPGKKMITSDGRVIPIRPVMEGTGEVSLDSRSIFQRIFGSVF